MNTTNPLQLIPYRARRGVLLTSIVIGTASPYILTGLNGWAATALSAFQAGHAGSIPVVRSRENPG